MKIVKFRELDRAAWDSVVAQSPDAWLTHTAPWIKIEERFFVSANLSFGLEKDGHLLGIQPLFLSEGNGLAFGERLLHSGIHRHTGLALHPDMGTGAIRAARQAAMREILLSAELYDVDRIQLNSHNLAPANRRADRAAIPFWVSEFGFQLGIAFGPSGMMPCPGTSTLNADQLLDLHPAPDILFARLNEKCRNAVRKAEKVNLEFKISKDPSDLERYVEIATTSAARTGEVLPPFDYYSEIFSSFAAEGRVNLAFAQHESRLVAGLILLTDKKAANYLAGVSLPDAMNLRPNNFLHWKAILWAKEAGLEVYRFGPSFPEVPREWPIAKVSHFKTTFGSRSLPIIQGSLFRHPELYISNLLGSSNHLSETGSRSSPSTVAGKAGGLFIAHHIQIFGFANASSTQAGEPVVLYRPDHAEIATTRRVLEGGGCVVSVLPSIRFAKEFGVRMEARTVVSPQVLRAKFAGSKPWSRLRTLQSYMRFVTDRAATVIVEDSQQEPVWLQQRTGNGGSIVFVGTDLASDLMRYRQGDPSEARKRPAEPQWGFPGERPNFLFLSQLAGEELTQRPADWWSEALADSLSRFCGLTRAPMLPNGAPGAIIVTGDDDQASLVRYAEQHQALGSLPVTYFLHPLTKHTKASLKELKAGRDVELGLHPDALDHPEQYAKLFSEQADWFRKLSGQNAFTVRNHGFLSDGYWGHAASWIEHGVVGSSNLPGLDGQVLNGSLLPARLLLDGKLTDQWSILTAVGDGVVFINGWNNAQSADCIFKVADRIRSSGVPGVIVLNLHPENIEKTMGMHQAARDVVASGFVAWTLTQCLDWFARRDQFGRPAASVAVCDPVQSETDFTRRSATALMKSLASLFHFIGSKV